MSTQKITRENLQQLYNIACNDWQKRIEKILTEQRFNNEITVKESDVLEAWNTADGDKRKVMKKYLTLPESIFDKIQFIEDVYAHLGIERKLPYPKPQNKLERYLNASCDIQHITKAYNGSTVLDFTNINQPKYYLWWKKTSSGAWVLHAVCCNFYHAGLGFGCYFATRDGAQDASVKFKDIFTDYLPE